MKDHLKAFEIFRGEPITFDCLDLTFSEEFVDFLSYDYIQKRRKERIAGPKKYGRKKRNNSAVDL